MSVAVVLAVALALVSGEQAPAPCEQDVLADANEFRCSGIILTTRDRDRTANVNCRGQTLECWKLQQLQTGNSRLLEKLIIQNCAVNSSLECVMGKLNATGVRKLWFLGVTTLITEETVRGLDMLDFLLVSNGVQNEIPMEAIKMLPKLSSLRLSNDGISNLTSNIFNQSGVPDLEYLEMTLNKLTHLPADVFLGLEKLKTLNLYKSNIEEIDENTFRGLDSLQELNLDVNSISVLPNGVFQHLPELRNLTIPMNQVALTLETGALSRLPHLKLLVLQSYEELRLQPGSLADLPSLQTLEMQGSGVRALPADLFRSTTALVDLDLAVNELSSLPETVFEGLEKLEKLNLRKNKLKLVTKRMFQNLDSIRELNLEGNLIETLPEYLFSTLPSLHKVSFANNLISEVKELTFQSAAITNLDLSHNQLTWNCFQDYDMSVDYYFEGREFQSPLVMLDRMDTLDLSHNSIRSVCSDWSHVMTLLRRLDLSFNKLANVTNADLHFLSEKLESVDLRNNQIATVELPSYPRANQTFFLGRNPFHCDCHLYQFLSKLEHLPYNVDDAKCELPLSLKHQTLSSIATRRTNSSLSLNDLTCPLSDTPDGCECIVRPAMTRTECSCHDLWNKTLPEPTNNGPGTEMRLTLQTQQHLEDIPPFVTELVLSGLGLETVPGFPESVRRADLSHNRLSRVPLELLRRNITLQLRGNRLKCDCWSQEDVGHLKDNLLKIDDLKSVQCADGGRLEDVDVPRLCYVFNATVIGVSLASLGVVLAVASIALYKYSLEIKVYLYNRGWSWLVKEDMLDADKEYDIFLSYVHRDVDLVKNSIQAVLDKEYKVCVHDRDWTVGDRIEDQIYRSVAQSRRTLIVLSNAFMESNSWALAEFEAAHAQSVADKLPRAVVILLEDVDVDNAPDHIKRHMQTNTYIKWGDGMFWERLRYALPKKMKAKDLRRQRAAAQAAKNFVKNGLNVVLNDQGELVNASNLK